MRRATALGLLLALPFLSCSEEEMASPAVAPGDPLPDLFPEQLARFQAGKRWFHHGWTEEEGLGPLYLQDRCSSCHDLPSLGGTGVETRHRMVRFDPREGCDPLVGEGGPVRQERSTPLAQALGIFREAVASGATHHVREAPPLLYGLGLVEAIPEASILALADPDDVDGDGISGRVHRLPDGRLGRFGGKAEVATIPEFVEKAFHSDIGLTSLRHPGEETLNGVPLPPEADPTPEPELSPEIVSTVSDFVRFLALPMPESPAGASVRDSIEAGERVFHETGCGGCHVAHLRTGPHAVPALSEKEARLYSDLLLHDLGPGYPGVCAGDAGPSEFRTARLTGLRYREVYSMGGEGGGLEARILAHGGEARATREAFEALGPGERRMLLRFLRSL